MNRLHRRLGTLAFALAAGTSALVAQETGTLSVTVRNKDGKGLAKAKVIVASPTQIGGTKTVFTDEAGKVRVPSLYPGSFTVTVEAEGYQTGVLKAVHVGVANVTQAEVKLVPMAETIVVISASTSTLDPTNPTGSVRLSTEVLDALPTQRTYTDFVRFAPGVISSPDSGQDFAVAGSLSRDNTGVGGARNNTYILDGVDTTNPQTGQSLSRFNSEIIQEQEIKTGGIQADVAARGGGLVSNVVTKSGSNTWAGSLNYYLQNSSLVAGRKSDVLTKDSDFSSFDTAFTLGGPILKDRWWFFASIQKQNTTTKGSFRDTATPTFVAKNAEQDDLLGFFKSTLQLSPNNTLELSLTHNKSKDLSLGFDTNIPGFDFDRDRTQRIMNVKYEGVFNDWVVTAKGFTFRSDATPKPRVSAGADIIVYPDATYNGLPSSGSLANYQKQEGGFGWYTKTVSERTGFSLDISKFQGQLLGDHLFKLGILPQEEARTANLQHPGNGGDYEYLAQGTANNLTWNDVVSEFSGATWADDTYVPSALDRARLSNPALDAYLTGLGNDYGLIPFQTLAPGSTSKLLEYRIIGLRYGNDAKVKRKSLDYYAQDTWTLPGNQVTAYLGVRFNRDTYYADDGSKLHATELNVAPRLGLTYNHKGQNKLKIYATYGRYFEPIKLDMVTFAGSFANARVEQMYIPYQGPVGTYNPDNWVTLRQRGGRETVDAALAPTLQSPYTDELRLGLERDLGHGIIFEGTYSHREDKRIVEDFDLNLYTDPTALLPSATTLSRIQGVYGGTTAYWNSVFSSLAYPLSHFGYTSIPANVNYVLGNLIGAERKFDVINLSMRRSDTGDGWTAFINYTHTKAKGNSLSSGDADFQGDTPRLDPRMPWMNGTLSGSVDNQAKAYLAHTFRNGWAKGLTLGGSFTYTQGINYTRGLGNSGRILGGPFIAGFDAKPGTRRGPSYQQFDLRAKYDIAVTKTVKGELFVDVFNALNRQTPTAVEESSNGVNGANPGDPIAWQNPRRFYLGARISF